MPSSNPLKRLSQWRFRTSNSEKLYGAIVAQARLPVFYRNLGVPDTLEGRFGVLALNLFAVLHALAGKEAASPPLAQALMDGFSKDMETVLRELGVSDLRIPKKMRALAGSSRAILEHYEAAFPLGNAAFAAAIEAALPLRTEVAGLSAARLASYVAESIKLIGRQPLAALEAGRVDFAEIPERP